MARREPVKLICDFCGHEERGKGYMQRHLEKHLTFFCIVCSQSYKQKSNLIKHLQAHFQKFICQYCGEELDRLEKFQKHVYSKHEPHNKTLILSVQSKERYDCRHCVRSFPTVIHRNSHEQNVHKGRTEAAFKCSTCKLIFITKEQLRQHSFDHFAGTLHFCPDSNCDRFFKKVSLLRSHMKIHEPPKYKCDDCDQKFFQSSNFSRHKKRCKGKSEVEPRKITQEEEKAAKAQLLSLGFKFKEKKIKIPKQIEVSLEKKSRISIKNDKTKVPDVKKLEVSRNLIEVSKNFKEISKNSVEFSNDSSKISIEVINPPEENDKIIIENVDIFPNPDENAEVSSTPAIHPPTLKLKTSLEHQVCQICGLKFSKKTELNRHLTTVHEASIRKQKEFSCDFCGFKHSRLSQLGKHMKIHEKKECLICGLNLKNLVKHMKEVHSLERPHVCKFCDLGFKTKHHLQNHLKTHDEPSECPICGKFITNMERHLQLHKKPKQEPFQCSICQKPCATKQSMQAHISRVHEKVPLGKYYTCTVCDLKFIRNVDLRRHSYIHYKGKIFSCEFPGCNEMFKKSFKLQTHMMVHNSKNEPNFCCSQCDRKYLRKTALQKHFKEAHPENVTEIKSKE